MKMGHESLGREHFALHVSINFIMEDYVNEIFTDLRSTWCCCYILGEADLQGRYDVVRVELQPSEQYKSVC